MITYTSLTISFPMKKGYLIWNVILYPTSWQPNIVSIPCKKNGIVQEIDTRATNLFLPICETCYKRKKR